MVSTSTPELDWSAVDCIVYVAGGTTSLSQHTAGVLKHRSNTTAERHALILNLLHITWRQWWCFTCTIPWGPAPAVLPETAANGCSC